MCLHSLDPKSPKESGEGWQVLIHLPLTDQYKSLVMPKNRKSKAGQEDHAGSQDVLIKSQEEPHETYPQGFHIFEKEIAAKDFSKLFSLQGLASYDSVVIRKVKYRGAHTRGIAIFPAGLLDKIHAAVVVAEYRTILERKEEKEE